MLVVVVVYIIVEMDMYFFVSFEEWYMFFVYVDFLIGVWVVFDVGWVVFDGKCVEVVQFYVIVLYECFCDFVQNGVDDVFYIFLIKMWILFCDLLYKF